MHGGKRGVEARIGGSLLLYLHPLVLVLSESDPRHLSLAAREARNGLSVRS